MAMKNKTLTGRILSSTALAALIAAGSTGLALAYGTTTRDDVAQTRTLDSAPAVIHQRVADSSMDDGGFGDNNGGLGGADVSGHDGADDSGDDSDHDGGDDGGHDGAGDGDHGGEGANGGEGGEGSNGGEGGEGSNGGEGGEGGEGGHD